MLSTQPRYGSLLGPSATGKTTLIEFIRRIVPIVYIDGVLGVFNWFRAHPDTIQFPTFCFCSESYGESRVSERILRQLKYAYSRCNLLIHGIQPSTVPATILNCTNAVRQLGIKSMDVDKSIAANTFRYYYTARANATIGRAICVYKRHRRMRCARMLRRQRRLCRALHPMILDYCCGPST